MLSCSSAVAEATRSLSAFRREIVAANGWSLRDLYRILETADRRPPAKVARKGLSGFGR